MWPQKGSNKPKNVSDQSNRNTEGSKTWKNEMSGKESSLYDSGRTDSGFLSGANLHSESNLSGEITPPSPKPFTEIQPDNKSYMRLDSGVDVGLSDQFSELSIDESLNDLDSDPKLKRSKQFDNINSLKNINTTSHSETEQRTAASLELCFQQDEEGDTQLHIAVIQGFIEVVYGLIRMVPNPYYLDIRNDLRQTGLHLAVLTSQPRIVRKLVCAGARTDVVDRNGNTPLHLAGAAGDLPCLRALTEPITVAETESAHLRYTPHQRQPHPPEIDMFNYEGLTCVHIAVMTGNIEILRHLHWLGADINAREWKSGRAPLHMAVEADDEDLAVILLQQMGAHPGITNYAGQTAFYIATRTNPNFIRTLIEIGVPQENDFSSDEEDDDDDLLVAAPFRDLHTNGGIVNAA